MKPSAVTLLDGTVIPILYENRAVVALDKPVGWVLGPDDRVHSRQNLQAALEASLATGPFWARSRNLRYLRFVHRLDAGTSGVLLFAKSPGAVWSLSRLFADRLIDKCYLAVIDAPPPAPAWTNHSALGPEPARPGYHRVDPVGGKPAETRFEVAAREGDFSLVRAFPITGRTHQIRLHLKDSGCPVLGDQRYGKGRGERLALRAIYLAYRDPFTKRSVAIHAPAEEFLKSYGFSITALGGSRRS